jgi:phage FluMu protein Com
MLRRTPRLARGSRELEGFAVTPLTAILDSNAQIVRCARCGLELARIEVSRDVADADGFVTESRWSGRRYQIVFDACWFRTANGRWKCQESRDRVRHSRWRRIVRAPRAMNRTQFSRVISSIGEEAVQTLSLRSRGVEAKCPRCSEVNRIREGNGA